MIYTTPIYAIVVSLLVGQLLFPWRRKRNDQKWHRTDTEKVAKVAAGDLDPTMTLVVSRASQRSVRVRDRISRHYPRILVVSAVDGVDSTSRTASRKKKNVARNNAGTNVLRYNETETSNDEQTSSPQISVPPPKISKDCVPDVHSRPTCNNVHETAMDDALIDESLKSIHFGGTRNVWRAYEYMYSDADEKALSPSYALKTLRWKRSFVEQTYRLQEKEAIALDHLSSASGIVGILGFCGTTLQSEYANRDTLSAFLKKSSSRANQVLTVQLLQIAWRLAQGVANMHAERSRDGDLRIIHRDLDASNIMLTKNNLDGTWDVRLDDFNQAYILNSRGDDGKICTYHEQFVCGEDGRRVDVRAPEECHDSEELDLNQSIDVYGLGTVLYYILTHRRAYNFDLGAGNSKEHPDWYRRKVLEGGYPDLPESIETNQDGAVQSIVKGMRMAMNPDADTRVGAQEIADFLLEQLRAYVRDQKYAYSRSRQRKGTNIAAGSAKAART